MTYQEMACITFDEVHADNIYTYGSKIELTGDSVRLRNAPMPPSRPLFKWFSSYNYQASRRSPELPLLIPERQYRLDVEATSSPKERFYLKLSFSNRQGEVIKSLIQRSLSEVFTCPKDAFTYEIILYGAGCKEVTFKCLRLYEAEPIAELVLDECPQTAYRSEDVPKELSLVAPLLEKEMKKG
ncbi:accessory Sec system protein Asp3 [Streptococcus sp. zg-JUN1979]|uniref:accessory Sec system protein Asp3 n=1 Tax=Streptococcus sp. zg-JUN1979 TaxID=3391450 RepID=UPI0039A4CABF